MPASTGLQLCLFLLALFLVHTFASWSPEASDSDLQVKSSDQKAAADITDAEEATQKGIQVALRGFKHEANLRLFSLDLIEEALQYFGRAVDLQPSSTVFHLNKLLTQSLIAEKKADDQFKRLLISQFQDLAAQKRKGSQNHRDLALVEFYLGYMLEILLEDVQAAKAQWKVVRAFGFSDLEENFWEDEAAPKGYIRFQTPPKNYKNFLHPFLVYLFLRDQYLDQVDAGPVPQFPSDETVLRETHSNPILRVEPGFDIQMGRQSLDLVNKFFNENEFVVLRRFFSQEEVNMLTEYYQTHVYGLWRESYDPTLMRANVYNDRLGFFTNKRKEALLNQITFPRPVKMSYAFLCHYEDLGQQGESFNNGRPNLRPHTDRKDNEITVTVTMTSPIWPIFVHTKKVPAGSAWRERPAWEESVEVDLQAGDALIFSGRSHTHWREALPLQIDKYSSMLYHYVDREFDFVKFRQVGEQGDY